MTDAGGGGAGSCCIVPAESFLLQGAVGRALHPSLPEPTLRFLLQPPGKEGFWLPSQARLLSAAGPSSGGSGWEGVLHGESARERAPGL